MQLALLPVHIDADATWAPPAGTAAPLLQVDAGDPVQGLRKRAVDEDASVLVVGSSRRGRWRAAAMGSVPTALAATAPVPLLIVPLTRGSGTLQTSIEHLADGRDHLHGREVGRHDTPVRR